MTASDVDRVLASSGVATEIARAIVDSLRAAESSRFGGVGGEPIVFRSADGAHLTDVDGNRYIDYIGSWGPMILGHQHPRVVAAVRDALDRAAALAADRLVSPSHGQPRVRSAL